MNRKSFTLIELLIVITIIGILAIALVPRISSGPSRARDIQRKADLQNLATAVELYYADHGEYPNSGSFSGTREQACVNGGGDFDLTSALSTYFDLPEAPGNSPTHAIGCDDDYYYMVLSYADGGAFPSSYVLVANMENTPGDVDNYFCMSGTPTSLFPANMYLGEFISGYLDGQPCPNNYAYYSVYH